VKRPRLVLAASSVALFAAVAVLAVLAAPWRVWLAASAGLALIAALQSVTADPRDLATALLLSLPPVLALLADAAPTWLVGPLAVLLLVAGELGAMSLDCQGATHLTAAARARLLAPEGHGPRPASSLHSSSSPRVGRCRSRLQGVLRDRPFRGRRHGRGPRVRHRAGQGQGRMHRLSAALQPADRPCSAATRARRFVTEL
jgi:hypothetical protein